MAMPDVDKLIKNMEAVQRNLIKLEAIADMSKTLCQHQDKDGKIYFDHLTTYIKKLALDVQKSKAAMDKNLQIAIEDNNEK